MAGNYLHHPDEPTGNAVRRQIAEREPRGQRTWTPTMAVIARSAGVFHWTADGRRLYDFTSGVLVANLGHNPVRWLQNLSNRMGWNELGTPDGFVPASPLTAYNAVTNSESAAITAFVYLLQRTTGGGRLEQVVWAASGSEAVHKAVAACWAFDPTRDIVLAARHGYHGKKGLAGAVSGCETDPERDPRVVFFSFPMDECRDVSERGNRIDLIRSHDELVGITRRFGRRIGTMITEPYLGSAGSFHPPAAYVQMLQSFCRDNCILFVLDEVQSNFGRTGSMFAFERYGLEPDLVVLGKSLANGVPVGAVAGRADVLGSLDFGAASDTFSGNPLACAAVLATLDAFAENDVLGRVRETSPILEERLCRLKRLPFIAHVRGEAGGMVWGIETCDFAGRTASDWANDCVLAAYRGDGAEGVHLLGPLANKVIRIAPPLVITPAEATAAVELLEAAWRKLI